MPQCESCTCSAAGTGPVLIGEGVGEHRLAVEHEQTPAAETTALGYDDAVGAALGNFDIGFYAERFVLDVGGACLRDADHAGVVFEMRPSAIEVRPDCGVRAISETGIDGQHVVLGGLDQKERFEI